MPLSETSFEPSSALKEESEEEKEKRIAQRREDILKTAEQTMADYKAGKLIKGSVDDLMASLND